ncbi:hypothetical protein P8452_32691 [Trifolium repens]|nr:hypothetical protein P8452_32691 [Trifolium repens]
MWVSVGLKEETLRKIKQKRTKYCKKKQRSVGRESLLCVFKSQSLFKPSSIKCKATMDHDVWLPSLSHVIGGMLNDPFVPLPPPSSNVPAPPFSSTAQPSLTWAMSNEQSSILSPANQASSFPSSLSPLQQMFCLPTGSPPIGSNVPPPLQYKPYFPRYAHMQSGLIEDFSSLTMQARLGTMDPLFDAKELPSPLDGEVKLKYLAETYRSHELQSQISTVTSAIPLRGP